MGLLTKLRDSPVSEISSLAEHRFCGKYGVFFFYRTRDQFPEKDTKICVYEEIITSVSYSGPMELFRAIFFVG